MSSFDVIIIGSGPGGYVSAIKCAQLGMSVAIVEKEKTMGGTCLNVGCIPSKALLDSSEHYHKAKKEFSEHGLNTEISIDFKKMIERKQSVVDQTTSGIDYLMDKNKITVIKGLGSFVSSTEVKVSKEDGSEELITGKNIVIATGSEPGDLPFLKPDFERIITSTEALELKEIPKHLIIIGGGVIGLELGSVYKRLGSEVTVIEYADRIVPGMDATMSKELQKSLKKLGIKFNLSTAVSGAEVKDGEVTVSAKNKKGEEVTFSGDYCLLSVGRRPYTKGLDLNNAGVEATERGFINVNQKLQTNVPNIYAIGDVVGGQMLAHKAEEEGIFVAEVINGEKPHMDYNLIPGVVYTWPEVAAVGKTEEQLKEAGAEYKVGKFPMRALGRARASMDIEGLIKVISDKKTDEILGVHMIGARVADLIMEAVVAMEFKASAEDISRISHPHPTYSEAVKEAALDAWIGKPLHT